MMNKIEEAIIYATVMHQGKIRKLGSIPYILHPLEVAQILATLTDDEDVITAGILHDIVDDTDGTLAEIGLHRLEPDAFGRAFASLNRLDLGMTAPPCGLELTEVRYPEEAFTCPASIRWHKPEED